MPGNRTTHLYEWTKSTVVERTHSRIVDDLFSLHFVGNVTLMEKMVNVSNSVSNITGCLTQAMKSQKLVVRSEQL